MVVPECILECSTFLSVLMASIDRFAVNSSDDCMVESSTDDSVTNDVIIDCLKVGHYHQLESCTCASVGSSFLVACKGDTGENDYVLKFSNN